MHSNNQKGFTLIELLVVIVIISILTAIAIPTYLNYTARAQVVTGIASISAMQDAMVDYYQENGTAPANRLAIGYSESGADGASKYVSSVEIVDGSIGIRYGNDATTALTGTGANIVSYAMYRNGDNVVSFLCTGGTVPTGLTLVGAAATVTNVPDQYLPGDCK